MSLSTFSQERPIHLLTFPLFFVLNHFFAIATPVDSGNLDQPLAWIFNFLAGLIICTALPVMLYVLLRRWFDEIKSGLFSTLTCLLFFFFQDLILASAELVSIGVRIRYTLPIAGLLFVLIYYFIGTTKKSLLTFNQFLNVLSAAFILYTTAMLLIKFDSVRPREAAFTTTEAKLTCTNCPDIYLIVLDSYTSNKSLRDYFHFSNQSFTQALEQFDFKVADNLTTAYPQTTYSMAAAFDFNQHDLSGVTHGLSHLIKNGAVIRSLTSSNYEIRNLTLFEVGDQSRHYTYSPSFPFSFINGIIKSSIMNVLIFDLGMDLKLYEIDTDILSRTAVPGEPLSSHPKFVYTHVLAPHPPFVIDSTGNALSIFRQPTSWGNPTAYVNQVKGLNKKVLKTVEQIMKASQNPVIIIMGDHGYRFLNDPAESQIESYSAFLAYRGPNQERLDSLGKSNDIFRLVFDGLK